MSSSETVKLFEDRAVQADELITYLHKQIADIKKVGIAPAGCMEEVRLREENAALRKEIEDWKSKLVQYEIRNNVTQIPVPSGAPCENGDLVNNDVNVELATVENIPSVEPLAKSKLESNGENVGSVAKKQKTKPAKEKKGPTTGSGDAKTPAVEETIDVSRLDLRIGQIKNVKKHPDADALYVEEVDVGEEKLRTVVSGLVRFVALEDLEGRFAVLLCNLKPAKMRGVTSEAMVMCASTPEKVEVLVPPPGVIPGDRVVCEGNAFTGQPDKELNPKKKIFEQVAPDLKTDQDCKATYKGIALIVPGKGVIITPTLANVQIK